MYMWLGQKVHSALPIRYYGTNILANPIHIKEKKKVKVLVAQLCLTFYDPHGL